MPMKNNDTTGTRGAAGLETTEAIDTIRSAAITLAAAMPSLRLGRVSAAESTLRRLHRDLVEAAMQLESDQLAAAQSGSYDHD